MNQNLTLSERAEQTKLTRAEEKIVETVMNNIGETAFLNGAQLANFCGVSASLVTRLIQKLGYDGFHEFKREMQEIYRQEVTPYDIYQKHLSAEGKESSSIHQFIVENMENLAALEQNNSEETIDAVARAIHSADKVYILAMFASESPVRTLAHYLDRLNISHQCVFDLGLSKKIEYLQPKPEDLVIAFSFQGILKEIYEACSYIVRNGTPVVSITDTKANRLTRLSEYSLTVSVSGSVFDYSHVATTAMVTLLANRLADTFDPEYLSSRFDQIRSEWKQKGLFLNTPK